MIDENEIMQAVGEIIIASGQFPRIVWANKDSIPARPYLALSLVPTGVTDDTMAKSLPVWRGFLSATIVTGLDEFETAGRALQVQLGNLFPAAMRVTMASGRRLLVPDHPQTLPPYRDGTDYRLPIRIPLRTDSL
jgi:hypothetical protein